MSKKYPDWFSPHEKPSRPGRPPKTVTEYDVVYAKNIDLNNAEEVTAQGDHTHVRVRKDIRSFYGERYVLELLKAKVVPNPAYDRHQARYLAELETFKEQSILWKECKKRWDEEKVAKDRMRYERLKKKFEG